MGSVEGDGAPPAVRNRAHRAPDDEPTARAEGHAPGGHLARSVEHEVGMPELHGADDRAGRCADERPDHHAALHVAMAMLLDLEPRDAAEGVARDVAVPRRPPE